MHRSESYWATVLCHRWSHWFDLGELRLHEEREFRFDGPSVRRIASAYKVARGLNLLPEKTGSAARDETAKLERAVLLARDLNALFTGMPDDMPGRFTHLVGNYNLVAEYLHNKQFSGLTKFAWFHSPRGWTMYDSLAARAMKVRSPDRYYGMLVELGFAEAATTANGHLEANGFGYLFGERIIDQLMLLKSNLDPRSAFRTAEAYLYWLPAEQSSSLERCAFEVASGLDNHPLVSHLR